MAAYYNLYFSQQVVIKLSRAHPRGWALFLLTYPMCTFDTVVKIFQSNPRRWYIVKKLVKLADRLAQSPHYWDAKELIMENVRRQTPYFSNQYLTNVEQYQQRVPKKS